MSKLIDDPNQDVSEISDPTKTPQNSTVNPPQEVPEGEDDVDDFNFVSFSEEGGEDGKGAGKAPEATEAGPVEEKPAAVEPGKVEQPAGEKPKQEAQPQTEGKAKEPEAPKPPEAQQQSAQPETTEQQTPPPSPEDIQAQYTEFFNQSVETLTEHVYKLSDDEKEALDSNPSTILPKLAATLHMQILTAATVQAAELIKTMVPQMNLMHNEEQKQTNQFYDEWPSLKGHEADVDRVARMYRQLNPSADVETARKEIGVHASVMLRLPLPTDTQVQAAPVVPGPVTPSGASSGGAVVPQGQPQKSWMEEVFSED